MRAGQPFPGGAGDGEGAVPLSAVAQPGSVGAVLDEDAAVHHPGHAAELFDIARMHAGGMAEAVLGLHRQVDPFIRAAHPGHRQHRKHLLGPNQGMLDRHFRHQQGYAVIHLHPDLAQDHAGILADELAVDYSRLARAALFAEDDLLHLLQLGGTEQEGFVDLHLAQQFVGDAVDHEHFFFIDTDDVVIQRSAENDISGGFLDIGSLVHHRRGITGTGADCPFTAGHGFLHHPGTAGHHQQTHPGMAHQRLGAFHSGFGHASDQVDRPAGFDDCLVKQLDVDAGDHFGIGMHVKHHRIARRQHSDGIANNGGGGVGGRGNGGDHPVGSTLHQSQAVVTAPGHRFQGLGAGSLFRHQAIFHDLAFQPPQAGFPVCFPGKVLGIGEHRGANRGNHLRALLQGHLRKLPEGGLRRAHRPINGAENSGQRGITPPPFFRRIGRCGSPMPQALRHLAGDHLNLFVGQFHFITHR